jgi:LmbE family N-acetylglucosaminyl deacetylase
MATRGCYANDMNNTTYFTPKVVLAIGAHADDMDVMSAGTLLRWASEGAEIYYLQLTDSSRGSSDRQVTPEQVATTRQVEQRAAAQLVGAKDVFFLDYGDGALENTLDLKRDIVRSIRQVKPDTVIGMDPTFVYSVERGMINHPDHRAAGQATLDAIYPLARDHLTFPELLHDEGLEPHKVERILLANFETQNYYVDISEFMDRKLEIVLTHASQFPERENMSRILSDMAESFGVKTGSRYAEGFVRIDLTL